MMPKVLIGAPVSDMHKYCIDEFLLALKNLEYGNYDVLLVDNSSTDNFYNELKEKVPIIKIDHEPRARERVTKAHNLLREKALKEGYDYLFILDQDVIPPPEALNVLISREKKAIAGLYFGHHILDDKSNKLMPFAWKSTSYNIDWNNTRYLNETEIWQPGLIRIAFAGGGCILLHKDVLKKIEFRYDPDIDAWDDRWLGYDLDKLGIPYFLDNTVKCKHLYVNRPFSWDEIRRKNLN